MIALNEANAQKMSNALTEKENLLKVKKEVGREGGSVFRKVKGL